MSTKKYLYEELDTVSKMGFLKKEISQEVRNNLSKKFLLRPYQTEAFTRFFYCLASDFPGKSWPQHFAFNMATGSGKTLIMAGLILYLYEKGYRNFLFFVNSTNIIEKTKANFLNPLSSKFLFKENIVFGSQAVKIQSVDNFEGINQKDINICFTTIQKLHSDLTTEKENSITYDDFKNKKIVLIADEAHHIQATTKAKQKELPLDFPSWENTVERIFKQDEDNLLLEFTATLDYSHKNIADKYINKVIFRYDLQEFRNDRYSKDVYLVQSDFDEKERILQALILNQYKQEVAAKNRINLKPVILFKAQKTIAQSQENKEKFHQLIRNLRAKDVEKVKKKSDVYIVKRAFKFFEENQISIEQLTGRLRAEFEETRCLSVNQEQEKETYQLLLNSLEDKDNRIRAIFAVQKLNEGWDVLNLFDIVRCYNSRDSKGGKPGKTTISEAQLIGRGARYFPFDNENNDRFRRKFDNDLENELRVLEDLHYHSINDARYISELRTALIEEGMIDEKEIERELKLKEPFKDTDFYKGGIVYINQRTINRYDHVKSFSDMGVKKRNYIHKIATGHGLSGALLVENKEIGEIAAAGRKDVMITDIEYHIIQNAISHNPFYSFNNLRRFFPCLGSIHELITSKDFLGGLEITFCGDKEEIKFLSNSAKFKALNGLLVQIETEIRKNIIEYTGTKDFKPKDIANIFQNKVLKLSSDSERAKGDEQFVSKKSWYVFNANYGTSEEKAFVHMLDGQIEKLNEKYNDIYLIRNERHFKIYSFTDGQAFEPDFVLFLKENCGELLTYQIFIEPKGKHLKEHDKWKKDFLQEIKDHFGDKILNFSSKQKYRLIGVPFYSYEDENNFKESLYSSLEN